MELAENQRNKYSINNKNIWVYKNRQEFYKYILFMGLLLALFVHSQQINTEILKNNIIV